MKLLLEHKNKIYRFLDIQQEYDGSVYVSVDRSPPEQVTKLTRRSGETSYSPIVQPKAPRKLSYHTTGRVNYHGLISVPPSFFEPLVDITAPNSVLVVSVPSCSLLDTFEQTIDPAVDCLVPVEGSDRFEVGVTFTPNNFDAAEGVRYDFSGFALFIHPVTLNVPAPSPDHFVYAAPPSLFPRQRIGKHEAELAYVQGDGGNQIVVVGPNRLGVYTMYFAAVMRAAPRVNVTLTNERLRFELIDNQRPHKLTFRIHGKGNLIRATDLRPYIRSIELDAEL
ncbi:hypothetical protein HHL25_01705 [Rhizobium sp. S-51]|uniref:Uncharacterized protein n=1 Tax=Rhizobium terricola TaxID=2728849 RepID=A0A7Y0ASU2_9HYPH|nr:hypothetical protein [Rhizobium terricola]NML72832.1 hypothetical protein [Rhizobium terricola]